MWACAQWMAARGRAQADAEAGEELHFFNDKSRCSEVTCMPPPTDVPVAPLFNLVCLGIYLDYYKILILCQVDDSDSTQQTIGQLIASMFDVKFGFHGFFMNTLAKVG